MISFVQLGPDKEIKGLEQSIGQKKIQKIKEVAYFEIYWFPLKINFQMISKLINTLEIIIIII